MAEHLTTPCSTTWFPHHSSFLAPNIEAIFCSPSTLALSTGQGKKFVILALSPKNTRYAQNFYGKIRGNHVLSIK